MEGSSMDSKNYGQQGFSFLSFLSPLSDPPVCHQPEVPVLANVIINNFHVNTMATV